MAAGSGLGTRLGRPFPSTPTGRLRDGLAGQTKPPLTPGGVVGCLFANGNRKWSWGIVSVGMHDLLYLGNGRCLAPPLPPCVPCHTCVTSRFISHLCLQSGRLDAKAGSAYTVNDLGTEQYGDGRSIGAEE